MLGEIDGAQFKSLKADVDVELGQFACTRAAIVSQVDKMGLRGETLGKDRTLSERVAEESRLTKALADMLVERVYVYPDIQIC